MRIAQQRVRAEQAQFGVPGQAPFIDLVPEHHLPFRLHPQRDEDRQQIGRDIGPGRGFYLHRQMAGEIALHLQPFGRGQPAPAVFVHHLRAELGEGAVDQHEMFGAAIAHRNVAAGYRRQCQEGGDFVVIIGKGVIDRAEIRAPLDRDHAGPLALDPRAHAFKEGTQFLHMRLARGVDDLAVTHRRQRADDEVFGGGDGCIFQPHPRGGGAALVAEHDVPPFGGNLRAKGLEHFHMRIDLARAKGAALHLMLQPRLAQPGEQAGDHHDAGAHRLRQAGLRTGADGGMIDRQRLRRLVPHHRAAKFLEERHDPGNIGDFGHVAQKYRRIGQQRGAQHRQHRILVGRRFDPPLQPLSTPHQQCCHCIPFSVLGLSGPQ